MSGDGRRRRAGPPVVSAGACPRPLGQRGLWLAAGSREWHSRSVAAPVSHCAPEHGWYARCTGADRHFGRVPCFAAQPSREPASGRSFECQSPAALQMHTVIPFREHNRRSREPPAFVGRCVDPAERRGDPRAVQIALTASSGPCSIRLPRARRPQGRAGSRSRSGRDVAVRAGHRALDRSVSGAPARPSRGAHSISEHASGTRARRESGARRRRCELCSSAVGRRFA